MYDIHLWKSLVSEDKLTRTTTERKAIFTDLDDNTEYQFQVRANTRKGPGPWSSKVSFRTDRNIIRAPLRVQVSTTVLHTIKEHFMKKLFFEICTTKLTPV